MIICNLVLNVYIPLMLMINAYREYDIINTRTDQYTNKYYYRDNYHL